jgi:hypothetical protein
MDKDPKPELATKEALYERMLSVRARALNFQMQTLSDLRNVKFAVTSDFRLSMFVKPLRHQQFYKSLEAPGVDHFEVLTAGNVYSPEDEEGSPNTLYIQFISQPKVEEEIPTDMRALKSALVTYFKDRIGALDPSLKWVVEVF